MKRVLFALFGLLLLSAWMLTGCTSSSDPDEEQPPALAFVGSDACAECHSGTRGVDHYTPWMESGHPYKLVKIDGEAPVDAYPDFAQFPNDFALDLPGDYTWDDISYVIGGYGWKMRWIANDGSIITGIEDNQYNFETDTYSDYHFTDPNGTKPYDCGSCHTTGWVADTDWDTDNDTSDNQDGMAKMAGTFFAGGVHCEECHGMGSQHVYSREYNMTVNASSEECGRCHTRGGVNGVSHGGEVIEAGGFFIKHHEQYDEWAHSPHNVVGGPGCVDCHDPHASVKFDNYAAGDGVLNGADCESCHMNGDPGDIATTNHNGGDNCVKCHMGKASKSAVAIHAYQGDIRTHLFAINSEPVGKAEGMFNPEGTEVLQDGEGMSAVTLDFACYGCHDDGAGNGGTASERSLQALSDKAKGLGDFSGNPVHTYVP
ncbi:hypothetical protein H8E52_09230 [bacterium]|nr:hypothetical protein [bacterium]